MKICTKCKQELDESNFTKNVKSKDGLYTICRRCQKLRYETTYKGTDKDKQRKNEYYRKNKERILELHKTYYKNNKEKEAIRNKQYRLEHENEIKIKDKERDKQLSRKISKFMHHGLTKACVVEEHWEQYFSYTLQELKEHLESQFQPGMTWENYGRYGWHIDHIIPQSVLPFDSIGDLNFKICWSLDNLRPLWYTDNLNRPKDGRDIPEDIKQEIISKISNCT